MTEASPAASESVSVPLDRIVADDRFQVRKHGTDPGIVKRYETAIRQSIVFPPVTLARVAGLLYCVDGFHRVAAHRAAECHQIDAVIVDATEREAAWIAYTANTQHGLPLRNAELREGFKRYVKAKHHLKPNGRMKAYREMAAELGGFKQHGTIWKWMAEEFPAIAAAHGAGDPRGAQFTGRPPNPPVSSTVQAVAALKQARNHIAAAPPEDREALEREVAAILAELRSGEAWKPTEPPPF